MFKIEPNFASINGIEVKLTSYSSHLESRVICNINVLKDVPLKTYPRNLNLAIRFDDEHYLNKFAPCPKEEVIIEIFGFYDEKDTSTMYLSFHLYNHPKWRKNLGYASVVEKADEIVKRSGGFNDINVLLEDQTLLTFKKFKHNEDVSLFDFVDRFLKDSMQLLELAEEELRGNIWHPIYESNESVFTQQMLIPTLRLLGFSNVRYNHGVDEFGRDILFTETDRFGRTRLLAAQVKAGRVSGGAKSIVDTLVSQVHDAFEMEVQSIGENNPRRISEMLVVTSGKYTNNAREKINQKLAPSLRGSVIFWDKEDLLSYGRVLLSEE